MYQEWKDKWIKALRSGDYVQGEGALRSHDDKFCCLGVLCDLVIKENANITWQHEEDEYDYGCNDSFQIDYPPQGIMDITGRLDFNVETFARMNDNLRMSFKEIAKVIETGILPNELDDD